MTDALVSCYSVGVRACLILLLACQAGCSRGDSPETEACVRGRQHGNPPPKGYLMWCADAAGKKQGAFREWWPSGKPKIAAEYRDGRQHGLSQRWFEDGRKQEEGEYVDGRRRGRWREWTEGGTRRELDYQPDGEARWTVYHPGGEKWVEGSFRNGREHGRFTEYRPDGTRMAEGFFEGGRKKAGTWRYWREDGTETEEELGSYAPGAFFAEPE